MVAQLLEILPFGRTPSFLNDILHGLTVTSWTPKRRYTTLVFTTEFSRTYRHINDRFID